ncbi:MAG: helix-hairpin-helix domain-containing protein [Nonlabens sp.]
MSILKSLFAFDKRQQRGILVLVILILAVFFARLYLNGSRETHEINYSVNEAYQARVDSIKKAAASRRDTIYPFNPNYITDYRGYKLGMTLEELDRLSRFRESGNFINSKEDFKKITGVSDQWLDSISPYFKFPAWVTAKKKTYSQYNKYSNKPSKPRDLNTASASQLKEVYGIGPALSKRIIDERERLKGFVDMIQVRSIYGLTDSTVARIKEKFYINESSIEKFALNKATQDELLSIPYFNDYLVDELIKQRTLRDGFSSWEEVMKTSRFPEEKLPLIQLYLTLD